MNLEPILPSHVPFMFMKLYDVSNLVRNCAAVKLSHKRNAQVLVQVSRVTSVR